MQQDFHSLIPLDEAYRRPIENVIGELFTEPYPNLKNLIESIQDIGAMATHPSILNSSLGSLHSSEIFQAKAIKNLTFEEIANELGRDEVAVAAIFYGQVKASPDDVKNLSKVLQLNEDNLRYLSDGFPVRGHTVGMPPKEPLIYRLYEIIQNYGYAYKAILNEKFGDGIMSGIAFTTKVEKEIDNGGNAWAVITLRGKWLPYTRF